MKEKLVRFMQGRYGYDNFSGFIMVLALVLMIINVFVGFWTLNIAALTLIVWSYCRILSRNISKRYEENCTYLNHKTKVVGFFRNIKNHIADRKNFLMFKCPDCHQKLRVPRGKGKIIVTCPKCKKQIYKKS